MSRAAKLLFVAQPTISQAILEIERHYHIKLFERLSKKLFITEKGEELLSYARHILSSFQDMETSLKEKNQQVLKIGATITIATCVLHQYLTKFSNKQPLADSKIIVDNTSEIEKMILDSRIDVALVEGRVQSKQLVTTPIMEDELVLVCSSKNPMFYKKSIVFTELDQKPFVLREKGSGTRALFEEQCIEQEIQIIEKWTCNNSEAIKNAVIESDCFSVISKMLITREVQEGKMRIIPIQNKQFTRRFYLVYHRNKFISESFYNFREIVYTIGQER